MIGITAFIGSALLFGGLILAGIAGWVIEVIWVVLFQKRMPVK